MAEQRLVLERPLGQVIVHLPVLEAIAARAVEKVEGVRPLLRGGGLRNIFAGPEEGLLITLGEEQVDVELRIAVVLGYPVHEVAQGVQQAVREDLEGLAGIKVNRVDVFVKQVIPPQEALVLEEENEEGGENDG
ncbi:hypothetical protein DRJ54_05810 [Candidatus Acetothermia bacterium]|nr:MAG: hypothetical protein DRJ54_05810 [Candidatus Acetothermia bacterium]